MSSLQEYLASKYGSSTSSNSSSKKTRKKTKITSSSSSSSSHPVAVGGGGGGRGAYVARIVDEEADEAWKRVPSAPHGNFKPRYRGSGSDSGDDDAPVVVAAVAAASGAALAGWIPVGGGLEQPASASAASHDADLNSASEDSSTQQANRRRRRRRRDSDDEAAGAAVGGLSTSRRRRRKTPSPSPPPPDHHQSSQQPPPPPPPSLSLPAVSSSSSSKFIPKMSDGTSAGLHSLSSYQTQLGDNSSSKNSTAAHPPPPPSAQTTIYRDKMGKIIDLDAVQAQQQQQQASDQRLLEDRSIFKHGLKQVSEQQAVKARMADSSSSFTVHAQDNTLRHEIQRAQERWGDPMAHLISVKSAKDVETGQRIVRPKCRFPAPPNRFGIGPGYRWDGIDRSNGFEKQIFATRNNKIVRDQAAYKWSTEDM